LDAYVSNIDGSVFLLVWQDEVKRRDGSNWVFLGAPENVQTTDNPVSRERLDHIKLLKSGKRGYLIFCDAKWSISGERNLSTFNAERVYPIGDIIANDSGFWAQYLTGILVKELRQISR
jgi:hypothetical protein